MKNIKILAALAIALISLGSVGTTAHAQGAFIPNGPENSDAAVVQRGIDDGSISKEYGQAVLNKINGGSSSAQSSQAPASSSAYSAPASSYASGSYAYSAADSQASASSEAASTPASSDVSQDMVTAEVTTKKTVTVVDNSKEPVATLAGKVVDKHASKTSNGFVDAIVEWVASTF